MSIPAWRPLKDAPEALGSKVVVRPRYVSMFPKVVECHGTGHWSQGTIPGISTAPIGLIDQWEYAPIADTLELDRAIQYAVALAFGQLIDALVMAHTLRSVGNEGWADIQQSEAVQSLRRLHTAFGGRIPDEVKP